MSYRRMIFLLALLTGVSAGIFAWQSVLYGRGPVIIGFFSAVSVAALVIAGTISLAKRAATLAARRRASADKVEVMHP